MIRSLAPLLGLVLLVATCGPVPPEQAARECEERARGAKPVSGQVRIGAGNGGVETGIDLGIVLSSDTLTGRDPVDIYDRCVRAKTGQGPFRPPNL